MKAINIKWDTDGDKNINLSPELIIPDAIKNDIDAISDYLSNTTGFCHFGFELEDK